MQFNADVGFVSINLVEALARSSSSGRKEVGNSVKNRNAALPVVNIGPRQRDS
jgi:hypothetical protein